MGIGRGKMGGSRGCWTPGVGSPDPMSSPTLNGKILYFRHMYSKLTLANNTWGNRTMVAATTIVSMAAAKKVQQNVFAFYHSYNRTILLGFICILDFHFKIVLVLRRCHLIPIRCYNRKRKMWPWRWLFQFDFSSDDGCTRWWRWLHYFGRVIFDTHTANPLQTNMLIGCISDCYQAWYV